jgi:1-acyl-sn-glycerol-3-phosphate acyltransferase
LALSNAVLLNKVNPSFSSNNAAAKPGKNSGSPVTIPMPSERLRAFWPTRAGRAALTLIIDYFHATLEGAEHIAPSGGALIVSNHALFALDTVVLAALIVRDLGRHPRFLADRMLWKLPGLRELITSVGALPGTPDAAEALLRRGELVIVYPGGVDDSLKLSSERYQLKWKARAGFARVALAAHVPIVPVVGLGIDEMYRVFGHEHWLGRRLFGAERYDLPVFLGAFGTILPLRVRQRFIALPPIPPDGDPRSAADVERLRAAAYTALERHLRAARGG